MKKYFLISVLIFGIIFLNSCTKEKEEVILPTVTPTSLELTLKGVDNSLLSGVIVKLYTTENDLLYGTNQVGDFKLTDSNGKVNFSDLSPIKYYFFAEKECLNNANGILYTSTALTANVKNTIDVTLTSTGTLFFVNNSSNPYRVSINGVDLFDIQGSSTQYLYYLSTGAYSIRVLQLSGYAITPTDQTYNATLTCGQTVTISFPQ